MNQYTHPTIHSRYRESFRRHDTVAGHCSLLVDSMYESAEAVTVMLLDRAVTDLP